MILLLAACGPAPPGRPVLEVGFDGVWHANALPAVLPAYRSAPAEPIQHYVDIPTDWGGSRLTLVLPATGWEVSARVDGVPAGLGHGGLWPATIDVTEALPPGRHLLELVISPPTVDNIVPGRSATPPAYWISGFPPADTTVAQGAPYLRVEPPSAVTGLRAELTGDPDSPTLRVDGVGTGDVALSLVGAHPRALGHTLADGAFTFTAPWSGPRWPDPEATAWVQATVDGVTREAPVVSRVVSLEPTRLLVDGNPRYLAAWRLSGADLEGRAAFSQAVARLAEVGANALEIHGEAIPPFVLDAADDLGLPVVLTPRCDGKRRKQGAAVPSAALDSFVEATDHLLVDHLRPHPSVVLWVLEAPTLPTRVPNFPGFLDRGLPVIPEWNNKNLGDPGLPARAAQEAAIFYGELPWQVASPDARTLGERLRAPLAAHLPTGVGLVLPALPADAPGLRADLRKVLAEAGVPPWEPAARPGPATLQVHVTRADAAAEGVLVTVEPPGRIPRAAWSDARGNAWIELEVEGSVRVSAGGAARDAVLKRGVWDPPAWTPAVTRIDLALP